VGDRKHRGRRRGVKYEGQDWRSFGMTLGSQVAQPPAPPMEGKGADATMD